MSALIKCTECGARNELKAHQLHCHHCGAKLDFSKVRADRGPLGSASTFVKRLARVAIFVFLAALLALLLWPTSPTGQSGTPADGEACFEKLASLYVAIQERRPAQQIFREQEVNGYLASLLDEAVEREPPSGLRLNTSAVNLSFTENAFVVHILSNWKQIRLSYEVEGLPVLRDGRFEVDVVRVSLGHVPIPAPLHRHFAGRLLPTFEQMERERYVLDHLAKIDLGDRRVRLRTGR